MSSKDSTYAQSSTENSSQVPLTLSQDQDSASLTFSPDHDLCTLWTLWSSMSRENDPLRLSLPSGGPPQHPLTGEALSREAQRLWLLLTQAAHARIESISAIPSSAPVDLDEEAFVYISSNEMAAWLFLFPAIGQGKQLSPAKLHQVLIHHGVTTGVNWTLLWKFAMLPQRYFLFFPIARGTDPIPGMEGRIIDRYPRSIYEDVQVEKLDQANYKTLNLVRNIEEGDIICEIVPPTKGIQGTTVTGRPIPAPDGQQAKVPQGRNTQISPDGKYLVAGRNGHVAFSGRDFQVKPVLHLYEKDLASKENVNFLGDIHIHCDVGNNLSIRAMGTIQIDGSVEVCNIEAGENIIVSDGVLGQERTNLHAQRSVYAKYLEYCNVYARNSVQADCIINCNIYSNGTVKVCTGRGAVVGGTIHSAGQVSATTVGSKAERPTTIILGGQPCEEAERALVNQELENITQELSRLEHLPSHPEQEQKLSQLRLNQYVAQMKLEKFSSELESHQTSGPGRDSRRLKCDTIYPGTTVTINHSSFRVSQMKQDCTIGVVDGFVDYL